MSAVSPLGCITCHLCNASISVKNGTFDKLQYHLETSHEVFYGYEVLMAIIFLEDHEKEVIVEKVLPRMKLCLETAKNLKKDLLTGKLDIEEKLFGDGDSKEFDEDNVPEQLEVDEKEKLLQDVDEEKEEEEDEEEDESFPDYANPNENPPKKPRMDIIDVNESLEISLDESDETLFFPDDTERRDRVDSDRAKDSVECNICQNWFKKKSMNKHTTRCQLKEKVRQLGLAKQAKAEKENNINNLNIDETTAQTEAADDVTEDSVETQPASQSFISDTGCRICGKTFSSKTNLKRHLRRVHRDTSQQAYS